MCLPVRRCGAKPRLHPPPRLRFASDLTWLAKDGRPCRRFPRSGSAPPARHHLHVRATSALERRPLTMSRDICSRRSGVRRAFLQMLMQSSENLSLRQASASYVNSTRIQEMAFLRAGNATEVMFSGEPLSMEAIAISRCMNELANEHLRSSIGASHPDHTLVWLDGLV